MAERILFSKENNSNLITPELKNKFSLVMRLAAEAKAYPDQSGFFVKTAGMTKNGICYKGGNKEYGHSDAFIHGETAVVSGLRDLTDSPIEVIGWHKDGEISSEDFGRPCGNCRDILSKYCNPETFLLNGNVKGYVVAQLKDYLFNEFRPIDPFNVDFRGVRAALDAAKGANNVYLPEKLKKDIYGAALITEDGMIWQGGGYTNVGYDAIPPIMNAIINWRWNYPSGTIQDKRLRIQKLVVAGEFKTPNIFYRDRQAILELDEILRKFTKNTEPLKVQIVSTHLDAFETDVEEMLPRPFSPGAFRMDDVMLGQLGKIIGKDNLKNLKI